MKTKLQQSVFLAAIVIGAFILTSCEKDKPEEPDTNENQFVSLTNPYLICANRNPGGVGFDFEYKGQKGGANNLDSLTVPDFEYDIKVKTIKAEKPDGSLSGVPVIQLFESVKAVNYSAIDTSCKGYSDYQVLNSTNIQTYSLSSDSPDFDLSSVQTGSTGHPLMQALNQELSKLVIGSNWREAASNTIADDEPVWILQCREGRIVKLIVTKFPASPAPTPTGYLSIEWDFVQ